MFSLDLSFTARLGQRHARSFLVASLLSLGAFLSIFICFFFFFQILSNGNEIDYLYHAGPNGQSCLLGSFRASFYLAFFCVLSSFGTCSNDALNAHRGTDGTSPCRCQKRSSPVFVFPPVLVFCFWKTIADNNTTTSFTVTKQNSGTLRSRFLCFNCSAFSLISSSCRCCNHEDLDWIFYDLFCSSFHVFTAWFNISLSVS